MAHFTYIIHSLSRDSYYIGESNDPIARCEKHNSKHRGWTNGKGPWRIVWVEIFATKREAKIRERILKAQKNRTFYNALIAQTPYAGELPTLIPQC